MEIGRSKIGSLNRIQQRKQAHLARRYDRECLPEDGWMRRECDQAQKRALRHLVRHTPAQQPSQVMTDQYNVAPPLALSVRQELSDQGRNARHLARGERGAPPPPGQCNCPADCVMGELARDFGELFRDVRKTVLAVHRDGHQLHVEREACVHPMASSACDVEGKEPGRKGDGEADGEASRRACTSRRGPCGHDLPIQGIPSHDVAEILAHRIEMPGIRKDRLILVCAVDRVQVERPWRGSVSCTEADDGRAHSCKLEHKTPRTTLPEGQQPARILPHEDHKLSHQDEERRR
eukprot:1384045-Prymnesium_polylepis.1